MGNLVSELTKTVEETTDVVRELRHASKSRDERQENVELVAVGCRVLQESLNAVAARVAS